MKKDFEEILNSPEKVEQYYSNKGDSDFVKKQKINGSHYGSLKGKKRQYSREELIEFLIKKNIKSEVDLKRKRVDLDPYIKDYKKEFGSWKEAKKTAWGILDRSIINIDEHSPEFFVKLAIQYGITKKIQFVKAHKEYPKEFPPVNQIMRIWKEWKNFQDSVSKMNNEIQVNKYMNLGRKLKRIPSKKEAEDNNIYLDKIIKTWADANKITLRHASKYKKKKMFDDYLFRTIMAKEYREWKRLKSYYYDKPIAAK